MPEAITPEKALERLDSLMPGWRDVADLHKPSWVRRWMEISGDSRATAYRMQNHALAIDDEEWRELVAGRTVVMTSAQFEHCKRLGISTTAWMRQRLAA